MTETSSQTQRVLVEFKKTRSDIRKLVAPASSGVYAVFLTPRADFPLTDLPSNRLIYIGSSTNLLAREYDMHFSSLNTGFSTLRRSIGALLKESLSLVAIPRSAGPSESNRRNYRFKPDGEERLSAWMTQNLEVGVCAVESNVEAVESQLIHDLKPVLCLKGWPNPSAPMVKELRKRCADEARRSAATLGDR